MTPPPPLIQRQQPLDQCEALIELRSIMEVVG